MNAIGAREFLCIPILRKQSHGRHRFAKQHGGEVFGQCVSSAFQLGRRGLAAQRGSIDEFLHCGFHRPQHVGRRGQADHLQRANTLMQLLAGNAKLSGVDLGQVRVTRQPDIAHKTAQRRRSGI